MSELYSHKEIARLVPMSEGQVLYWDKAEVIAHVEKKNDLFYFDFQGLVAFKAIKHLERKGISLRRIRMSIKRLRRLMPESEHPLSEVRISLMGNRIVFQKDKQQFTADGQLVLDFDAGPEPDRSVTPLPSTSAEELFFQALEAETEGKFEEAQLKYEAMLRLDPKHVDALVSLGNIMHIFSMVEKAEGYYRRALDISPDHAEANYNFANLLEERGETRNAIFFYRRAVCEDPEFADAHFNLARLLTHSGDATGARTHWERYLELDPDSEWARYVEQLLKE